MCLFLTKYSHSGSPQGFLLAPPLRITATGREDLRFWTLTSPCAQPQRQVIGAYIAFFLESPWGFPWSLQGSDPQHFKMVSQGPNIHHS